MRHPASPVVFSVLSMQSSKVLNLGCTQRGFHKQGLPGVLHASVQNGVFLCICQGRANHEVQTVNGNARIFEAEGA